MSVPKCRHTRFTGSCGSCSENWDTQFSRNDTRQFVCFCNNQMIKNSFSKENRSSESIFISLHPRQMSLPVEKKKGKQSKQYQSRNTRYLENLKWSFMLLGLLWPPSVVLAVLRILHLFFYPKFLGLSFPWYWFWWVLRW